MRGKYSQPFGCAARETKELRCDLLAPRSNNLCGLSALSSNAISIPYYLQETKIIPTSKDMIFTETILLRFVV